MGLEEGSREEYEPVVEEKAERPESDLLRLRSIF